MQESPRVAFEPAAFSAISEKVIYEIDTTGMEKEMCWREN